jgi:F0F1-type ATP synthase assembly protein I
MPNGAIKKLLIVQVMLLLVVTGLLSLSSAKLGLSAFCGMLVMFIANAYVIRRLFGGNKPNFDPKRFLVNFYLGEIGKFVILALGTALLAKTLLLSWWAYILGVAIMQFSIWLTPLWLKKQKAVE